MRRRAHARRRCKPATSSACSRRCACRTRFCCRTTSGRSCSASPPDPVPRPVIALLTDFGLHDHYVGAMKGVVLGICPDATLVDITHDIPPQDVATGALELAAA